MNFNGAAIGPAHPPLLIAGPCVIESADFAVDTAGRLRDAAGKFNLPFIYKSSYDKANRTSVKSFRGPGIREGLTILDEVRRQCGVALLTDVHSPAEAAEAATVVDVLQTPAFLCRQTDLITAAAASGRYVNIKKGQFLSPAEMNRVAQKAAAAGGAGKIMLCERGASFGYHNLVVDMRALVAMRASGCPVIFDASHSVQLPGAGGDRSGGEREFIAPLARAAVACGVSGLFVEAHPDPANAPSDGASAWPLDEVEKLLTEVCKVHFAVRGLFA